MDLVGKSGQRYAFTRLDGETFLRQIGVTFVIAVPDEAGWRVRYAGETNNLADGSWQSKLTAERARRADAQCFVRLNVGRRVREAEVNDIEVHGAAT